MALDFPSNPIDGEVFDAYIWSASKGVWQAREEQAAVTVISPVAPTTANNGDLWLNSSTGILFAYYDDGSSQQWVEVVSSSIIDISNKAETSYVDNQLALKANLSGGNTFSGTQTFSTPLDISSGGTGSSTVGGAQANLQMPLSQNYVINGGFDMWQRNTSSTAGGYSTADRWYSSQQGTVTKSQQTAGVPVGSIYCMRVAYGAASSLGYQFQALESGTVTWLKGKQVTLSALVRRNASFTAGLTLSLQKSTTANVVSTGTWVGIANVTVPNASLPTGTGMADWYKATVTTTIPNDSTVAGLRVVVQETAVQTTGAYYELAQVQLEEGSVATSFRRSAVTLQGELAECQRFYQIGRMVGRDYGVVATIDSGAQSNYSYQVQPRATPTLTNISLSLSGGGYDYFYEFNSIYGTGFVYRKGGSTGNGNNYFDLTFSANAELP